MRILIIDNSNLFLKSYVVNPSLSRNGEPIGGVIGSLKSIQKIVREAKPDKIVIAYDGTGGSRRRKQINKEYKAGRNPVRLNRFVNNLSASEEEENKFWQFNRLAEYYDNMPVYQFIFDGVEADDVAAYICKAGFTQGHQKVIYSSDKDFIQLLDDETILYRATQKEILNKKSAIAKYAIHPENFALAKALSGDVSDNIKGIPGVGMKSIAKRFPYMIKEDRVTIDDIVDHSAEELKKGSKLKIYENIVAGKKNIVVNYSLVQLYISSMSVQDRNMVRDVLKSEELFFNKTEILKMMIIDGMGEISWETLFRSFKKIVTDQKIVLE